MARSFSPSLSLSRCRLAAASLLPSSQTTFFRSQSSNYRANRGGELYEIDTATSQSQSDPLLHKLEDAVHRIMVRRSAPDWLPFVPGASLELLSSLRSWPILSLMKNLFQSYPFEDGLPLITSSKVYSLNQWRRRWLQILHLTPRTRKGRPPKLVKPVFG